MIRLTTLDDVEPLVELTEATGFFKPLEIETLREVFDDYFEGIAAEADVCATLERDGVLLGFTYFGPAPMTDGSWDLWWLVVRKNHQGRGLGRELLRYSEREVKAAGGRILWVETSSLPLYESTRQFYVRNGYEREAVLRDYYVVGDDLVTFRKVLSEG
jgi:GNAT superfamily N-acetyltransferase